MSEKLIKKLLKALKKTAASSNSALRHSTAADAGSTQDKPPLRSTATDAGSTQDQPPLRSTAADAGSTQDQPPLRSTAADAGSTQDQPPLHRCQRRRSSTDADAGSTQDQPPLHRCQRRRSSTDADAGSTQDQPPLHRCQRRRSSRRGPPLFLRVTNDETIKKIYRQSRSHENLDAVGTAEDCKFSYSCKPLATTHLILICTVEHVLVTPAEPQRVPISDGISDALRLMPHVAYTRSLDDLSNLEAIGEYAADVLNAYLYTCIL